MWRPVVGYEGLYEVSDKGLVRSIERVTTTRRTVKGRDQVFTWTVPEHILKYGKRSDDYLDVPLTKHGHSKNICVHRIVAEAFIPNPKHLPCVNHIDGNKKNNNVDNLEWCTYSSNNNHAVDMKLNVQCIPIRCVTNGLEFPSMTRAEAVLKLPKGSVSNGIKRNEPVHGFMFEKI